MEKNCKTKEGELERVGRGRSKTVSLRYIYLFDEKCTKGCHGVIDRGNNNDSKMTVYILDFIASKRERFTMFI